VDEEVTDSVHPENLRVALAAAELFGLDVVGVDIISPDISEPWYANGAIINEVNFAPLLGGGETSRRYIDEYLNRLLEGDGRIPIEAFVGGEEAWSAALARRKALGDDGAGIFVTNARRTLDGNGHEIPMPFQSLHGRSRALLLSRQVRALLLVVQDDEWLRTGLPVEYLDRVVDSSGALRQHRNPDLPLPKEQEQALRQLLAERLQATAA
jgi:cyanophycin synthetase